VGFVSYLALCDAGKMNLYSSVLRPFLFKMDAETAHSMALGALQLLGRSLFVSTFVRKAFLPAKDDGFTAFGMHFKNRLGIAAGFDKDAKALWGVYALGFGFAEVGSVSYMPWKGNPKPRIFRVPEENALINRVGLPSEGAEKVKERLASKPPFPVFVNIAKTGDPTVVGDKAIEDICMCAATLAPVADAFVLNLSCPNTPDGQTFQDPSLLSLLLKSLCLFEVSKKVPLFLKVSPDLDSETLSKIAITGLESGAKGFVATNTSKGALSRLRTVYSGGVSGKPILEMALKAVKTLKSLCRDDAVIIGCGGVFCHEDYVRFRDAGADLVEVYTGFVYQGPFVVRKVLSG